MILLYLIIFVTACVILAMSNIFVIKSLTRISHALKINEFSISFILVSISTSLPEAFVGVMSAIENTSSLSLGNVLGSSIIDMTLIMGLSAILAKNIKIESKSIKGDLFSMVLIIFLPVFLFFDHLIWNFFGLFPGMIQGLSRIDGVLLLSVFVIYIYSLIRQESRFSRDITTESKNEAIKYMLMFIVSIVILLGSAHFVVEYAQKLAFAFNMSAFLIGIFLVAVGTTLPELTFNIRAALTGHESMALGDIIGSVIANSTLVLGLTSIIRPIQADPSIYLTSMLFMLFCAIMFFSFSETDNKLTWKEGISLMTMYVIFVILQLWIRGGAQNI
jgi:cation:H+ antiporter